MAMPARHWMVYAPVALLPLLAAWALGSAAIEADLVKRGRSSLDAAGAGWAKLAIEGRDARLAGDSPSQEAIDAAVAALLATRGIRLVENVARVVLADGAKNRRISLVTVK